MKDRITDMIRRIDTVSRERPLLFMLVFGLAVYLVLFIILGFLTHYITVYESLFRDPDDIFMDFFNSVRDSLDDPYTNKKVIYPPFAEVVYMLIGGFISPGTRDTSFDIRNSYEGMFSYMLFTMIAVILVYRIMNEYNRKSSKMIGALIVLLILSYPLIFAVMRGNCIIYSLIFIMLFLLGYRSENKTIRYLSYLSLGIASGFKIYAAFFGVLVLRERNLKDVAVCVAIGLLMFLVPFVFTDGNPIIFLKNSFGYSMDLGGFPIVNIADITAILVSCGLPSAAGKVLTYVLILAVYAFTVILIVLNKNLKEWEALAIVAASIIIGFGTPAEYNFILMIPAIITFASQEDADNKKNGAAAFLFVIIMAVMPGIPTIGLAPFITVKGLSTIALCLLIIIHKIRKYGLIDKPDRKFTWNDE